MNAHENSNAAGRDERGSQATPEGISEEESLRKDTSYSPASESETQSKQEESMPDTIDDDIDADDVRVRPGTGGPDDSGDIDVDPGELHMPGR